MSKIGTAALRGPLAGAGPRAGSQSTTDPYPSGELQGNIQIILPILQCILRAVSGPTTSCRLVNSWPLLLSGIITGLHVQ